MLPRPARRPPALLLLLLLLLSSLVLAALPAEVHAEDGKCFAIKVIDRATGRGVPLVELRTVNEVRHVTDSAGLVCFREPGLMNTRVFFHVKSHGYRFPKDGFGYRGTALQVVEGGSAVIRIDRINVAERLYRVTGAGIYRDSRLAGRPVPIRRPLLNGRVTGSDSVVNTIYRGEIHWFWGDTNRPRYPLGNFSVSGATSLLPKDGGLDPEKGVDLRYFTGEEGFAKKMAPVEGPGPTWIDGLVTLKDAGGRERMLAHYVKIKEFLEPYQRGLVAFDDERQEFVKVKEFPLDAPLHPYGHPVIHSEGGVEHVYFADPYPLVRVRATVDDYGRLASYEAYTCLEEGTRVADERLDRDLSGRLKYGWKGSTPPLKPEDERRLSRAGKLGPDEALLQLRDVDTGRPVLAHRGSVYRNAHRRRWVMVFAEAEGSSYLGETWYAEADGLLGPWVDARKIITHERYSFYNPKQHPFLDKHGGRVIFLEGTYSDFFSGSPEKTPRYDYNQVVYRLDLADPRLNLPVAIYRGEEGSNDFRPRGRGAIVFFALERPGEGTVEVHRVDERPGVATLATGPRPGSTPLFHALAPGGSGAPGSTADLLEFRHADGARRAYSVDPGFRAAGFQGPPKALCRVWKNPMRPGVLPGEK